MKRQAILWLAALGLAIVLAACNNSNPNPLPTLGPDCVLPAGTQTVLVYPAPGATAVPGTFGQVIIGSTAALPSSWVVAVTDALNPPPNYIFSGGLQTASPPFPTPNATPSFANPQYQSGSYSGITFAPGQTVTAYVNNTASNCTPVQIGTFST